MDTERPTNDDQDREHVAAFAVASTMFAAYCHALDSGSPHDLRQLFADDAVLELADVTHQGVDAIAASYDGFFASTGRTTRHHITNVRVVDSGPTITAEAYLLVVTSRDGRLSLASGSYADMFVRVDDRWRIARKRIALAIPFTRLTP